MRPPPLKQESLAEHKPAAGRAGAAVALHAVLHAIQPLTARPHWQPGRDDGLLPQGQVRLRASRGGCVTCPAYALVSLVPLNPS
jgi:hypothetical protein